FKQAGLVPLSSQPSFLIPFSLLQKSRLPSPINIKSNKQSISNANYKWIGKDPLPMADLQLHDFTIIKTNQVFTDSSLLQLPNAENILILSTTTGKKKNNFPKSFILPEQGLSQNILLVYSVDSLSDLL